MIGESGRELQRQLLEASLTIDSAREERIEQVASAAMHPAWQRGARP